MSASHAITVLHLSDLQFGANHHFASGPTSDAETGSLLNRVATDLDGLTGADPTLRPDLILVTGDLAEKGRPSEFRAAAAFLRGLAAHLAVDRNRVIVLPGNHDINRDECAGYFQQCAASETIPVPPFWPKWKQWVDFLRDLYDDNGFSLFTRDEPWSVFEVAELKVAVALMNSTIAESHRDGDHYGWIGEEQMNWFVRRFTRYRRDQWLRIAALHHNVRRGPVRDDENLHDADALRRILGDSFNVLFHGHTHDGQLDWLFPHLPILSTGSAAVNATARPIETPNQYQIVRIERDRLTRFARAYVPSESRWIGDTRVSSDGSAWRTTLSVPFVDVAAAFPDFDDSLTNTSSARVLIDDSRQDRDDFLARVGRLAVLREHGGAETERMRDFSGREYLRMSIRDGDIQRIFPIGASPQLPTPELLDEFVRKVHARYAEHDSGLISHFVYGGHPRASAELTQNMARLRVHLMSFVEYEGLLDFRDYTRDQTALLANDTLYPPALYVPQRMRYTPIDGVDATADAVHTILDWLAIPQGRLVLVLGEFGSGKTFLMHELARRMGLQQGGLVPILIQLRDLEKGRTLDQLIAQHFAQRRMDDFRPSKFRYMLEHGRIALLFDGFDELAIRVTYARATEHFDTLLQAAAGLAKVVITSRTQHFMTDQQVKTAIGQRVDTLAGRIIATLVGFDDNQIQLFLSRKLGSDAAAEARFALIRQVRDLLGLSHSPRMLGFIAELPESTLLKVRGTDAGFTPAQIYREILERWLVHEFNRVHPRGAQSSLTVADRWNAVTALALRLWQTSDRSLTLTDLSELASSVLRHHATSEIDAAITTFQIGSGTLLVRDEEGNFSFLHQSILEWLVASRIATDISDADDSPLLAMRELSALIAEFLVGLAPRERLLVWARRTLANESTDVAKKNAMLIRAKLGVRQDSANTVFRHQDLRGADLSGHLLTSANFDSANLADARLIDAVLEGATLDGATLTGADLSRASMVNASLKRVDLSRANLTGADLRGAVIQDTTFYRAKLIGAHFSDERAFLGMDAARFAERPLRIATTSQREPVVAVAWNTRGDLFATAGSRCVHVWDAGTGLELDQFNETRVTAIRFLDHRTIATINVSGRLRIWTIGTNESRILIDRHGALICLDISANGAMLAAAGAEATVFVWERRNEQWAERYRLGATRASVNAIHMSADGHWLAAAASDHLVHIWDLAKGRLVTALKGHTNIATAVAFVSRNGGQRLISGDKDGNVITATFTGEDVFVEAMEPGGGAITQIVVALEPQMAAIVGSNVTVIDLRTAIRSVVENIPTVLAAQFNPNGEAILLGCADGSARVWDVELRAPVKTVAGRPGKPVQIRFANPTTLLSASPGTDVHLWDLNTGEEWWADKLPHANAVALHVTDGRPMVSLLTASQLTVRDITQSRDVMKAQLRSGRLVAAGDGGRLLAVAEDNDGAARIRVFNVPLLIEVLDTALSGSPLAIALSSGDRLVAVITREAVEIIDIRTERHVIVGEGLHAAEQMPAIAFAADESMLAISYAGVVELRALDNFTSPLTLRHRLALDATSMAFHPSKPLLFSGGRSGVITAWNLKTGGPISRLPIHHAPISGIVFDLDGQRVASASTDGKIAIWGFDERTTFITLVSFEDGWAAYTPSGSYKCGGNVSGLIWHTIGLCRFEVGELDEHVTSLRIPNQSLMEGA